jgi:hypothetical protein
LKAGLNCKNRDKLIGYTSCLLQLYYFHNVGVCTKPGLLIIEERLFDSRRDRGTRLSRWTVFKYCNKCYKMTPCAGIAVQSMGEATTQIPVRMFTGVQLRVSGFKIMQWFILSPESKKQAGLFEHG